jgi:FlaA1/EpsC-like NDP-sugar epimerase
MSLEQKNLLDAAKNSTCERFVLISTDKAVEPASIYGASKYIAEELVLSQANANNFKSMVVRFGNVLGSRGSIIPIFSEQIVNGGPVTITDKNASRFFMTIEEAASLVLKAGGVGEEGKLYVLEMGDPINIEELAKQLIDFYGYKEDEIPIQYIGLRPGEKLHEALTNSNEEAIKTEFPGIQLVKKNGVSSNSSSSARILELIDELSEEIFDPKSPNFRNRVKLRSILRKTIPSIEVQEHEPEF